MGTCGKVHISRGRFGTMRMRSQVYNVGLQDEILIKVVDDDEDDKNNNYERNYA